MNLNKEILINNKSFWRDVQSIFSIHYPFLKIELCKNIKTANEYRNTPVDSNLGIKLLSGENETCVIDINSKRTVSEVLLDFKNKLELKIQVFRKSGNVWNLITITDGWSLENQNAAGEFISSQMAITDTK